ncbi:MAG: acetylornithine transaminase [Bacillota bacterium]|uniref:Acetylornithine aminotransferase n=1 Tax=Thermanaerosceptrum fracticalcis TaxID=1712410 RepID=A0A7G6E5Y8_THEFR|nr:acetylornithine transaminase [Thermanaerosceptrum fracticalcis]QNB47492.1 acetylornithine transaminase [Thermanaerosceptrum fracticalcis]
MNNETIMKMGQEYVMNTYLRQPFALVRGQGSYVWDADGNKYLDMVSGIAVNNVGHCHPKVVEAIQKQAQELLHCSNLYWIEPQVQLAKMITDHSCGTKVFFCNSGAEANEGAIKLARKWASKKYGSGRYEIITALHSFHGRTLTALTATGQEKYQKGFEPLTPGFKYVPYNDLEAMTMAITPQTCAILLEPLQGEGGVYAATPEYMTGVKKLCEEHGLLLMFDEVQTGLGRTGKLFGYEHYGIEPDVFTLAKGLGGGVPIGAVVAKGEAAETFSPGEHASTFGGNPLATAAAIAALSAIIDEKMPQQAFEKGQYITEKFLALKEVHSCIQDVRGLGLLVGMELSFEAKPVQDYCLKKGIIINTVQNKVVRLVPPLNIPYEDIDKCIAVIAESLKVIEEGRAWKGQ